MPRKRDLAVATREWLAKLQLSRGTNAAETLFSASSPERLVALQLSRGTNAAETAELDTGKILRALASIEPRHECRGNVSGAFKRAAVKWGFN